MIHRDVEIVDLYPLTWRNVGALFRIDEWSTNRSSGAAKVLTVLHDRGQIVKIEAPPGITPGADISRGRIADPQAFARGLYEAYPGLTRVQVFDATALRSFSTNVQRLDWTKLSSGDFYLNAFQFAEADPTGLCFYPPEHAPYGAQKRLLKSVEALVKATADGSTLVLGVYDHGQPYFTLIVQIRGGLITLCTTFEYLQNYGIDPAQVPASEADKPWVIAAVEQAIGPVAQAWFGERSTLAAWLQPVSVH